MSNIIINAYNQSDFACSDKAIWVVGVWSAPRLEPLYINFFLPKNFIAVKDGEVYIPDYVVEEFNRDNLGDFRYNFPTPNRVMKVDLDMWKTFRGMYKFPPSQPTDDSGYNLGRY